MKSSNISLFLIVLAFLACFISATANAGQDKPIVILIEKQGAKTIYKVDCEQVESPELLKAVAYARKPFDRYWPVVVLYYRDLPHSTIVNIRGIVEKVGYSNIRYFYYYEETDKMREVYYGPVVPYSTENFPIRK